MLQILPDDEIACINALSLERSRKSKVLLLGPTGISAVNVSGTPVYSGLVIKARTKLFGLNFISKASL